MLHKIIGTTVMLLLMTGLSSAQDATPAVSGGRPGLHLKDSTPSASKQQKQYDKELDSAYRSTLKDIPEKKNADPWGDVRTAPSSAGKNKQ